jgi:Glycosyl hydrolase family 12
MKAILALAVVVAALLTGFTIPAVLVAHTSSGGVLVGARVTCKAHGHRHHHWRCQRRSRATASSSPTPTNTSAPTPTDTSAPTPTDTSAPAPTDTSAPAPTDTSAPPSPTGAACVTAGTSGNCGPYHYAGITNSNGFNTYVGNNCWADPSCQQTVTAHDPGNWSLSADEPAGNTAVKTYPDTQQLMNNFSSDGTWSGSSDTPISGLSALSSTYAETMPHNSGTTAQAAWDIWLSNDAGFPNEVMVWVDNVNRGDGGATQKASASFGGQDWTLYQNGGGELIWSLGAPGTFAQQGSGTVDLLALLRWLQNNGHAAAGASIGEIDFGWEICSTGGMHETFTVSNYDLKSSL